MAKKDEVVAVDLDSKGDVVGETTENFPVPEDIPALKELTLSSTGLGFVPNTFEEVFSHFQGELVVIEGSPYEVVDKKELIGAPFVITDVRFYEGKFGPAVAICGITSLNKRFVFNDGSSGIFEAIKRTVAKTKRTAGILVEKGLRASTYDKEIIDGMTDEVTTIEATTYYFA